MTEKLIFFLKIDIFRKLDLLSKFCLVTFSFPSQTCWKRQKWHSRLAGSELPRSKSIFGSKIRSNFPIFLSTFTDFIRPFSRPKSTQNIAQSRLFERSRRVDWFYTQNFWKRTSSHEDRDSRSQRNFRKIGHHPAIRYAKINENPKKKSKSMKINENQKNPCNKMCGQ